jgi:hypothetical protein
MTGIGKIYFNALNDVTSAGEKLKNEINISYNKFMTWKNYCDSVINLILQSNYSKQQEYYNFKMQTEFRFGTNYQAQLLEYLYYIEKLKVAILNSMI